MPPRSKIAKLPAAVLRWLTNALSENGYSDYELLAAALREQGFNISKTSLHRYGQNLERNLALVRATTQAAADIAATAPDDADLRSAATISLIQSNIFDVLLKLEEANDETDPAERLKMLGYGAKSIAELTKSSVLLKRFQIEMRAKAEAAANDAVEIGRKGGLSTEALEAIKTGILGIVS